MDVEENKNNTPESSEATENQPKVEPQEAGVRQFSSFEEGVVNGVLRIETHPFLDFLEHYEKVQLTQHQLAVNTVRAAQKQAELTQVKEDLLSWKEKLIQFTEADKVQYRIINNLENERQRFADLIQFCRAKADACVMEFPLFSALLFFIAAIVFIGADVLFTKNVVGYIFDFGEQESWIIAVGLSFITFLIKPVIDRMIEKPYRSGTHIKLVHGTYLVLAIVALLLLFVLGHLRLLGVENVALENTDLVTKIAQTPSAFLLFVLSSMLFALAGATSLSISLPNLTAAERKIRYRILIRWYNSRRLNLIKQIEAAFATRKDMQIGIEHAQFRIDQLRPLDMLASEWQLLLQEGDELMHTLTEEEIKQEQALYREGVERGAKFKLNGELYFSPYQVLGRIFRQGLRHRSTRGGSSNNNGQGSTRDSGDRNDQNTGGHLHKEIRKMIDFTFTRNQNGY